MSRLRTVSVLSTAFLLLIGSSIAAPLEGQGLRDRLKRAAQNATEREIARQVDKAVTGMIRCALNDSACVEEARENGQPVEMTDEDGNVIRDASGNPVSDAEYAKATRAKPGEGVWSSYEFVPGERTLFLEDFSKDDQGDFPRRLEFLNGNMEVVESDGMNVLRATSGSAFAIPLPETLPERFTLEFPVHWASGNRWMRVLFDVAEGTRVAPRAMSGYPHPHLQIDHRATGIKDYQQDAPESMTPSRLIHDGWVVVRVMADGGHVKVFMNERRVANVPQVDMGRASKLWFIMADATDDVPLYIGAITVAAGGRDLYDRLEAEGTVATRGILFNTNSHEIRPESTPTLKEIGEMLMEHPDLRLGIHGHTDNVGDDEYNRELSERRARSVMDFLVEEYGVETSRLESRGFGEAAPVDSNDTEEGRANNRRVELSDLRREG